MAGVRWHQQTQVGGITETQFAYLQSIGRFIQYRGRLPTLRELADWYGVGVMSAHRAVGKLEAKGFLRRGNRGRMTLTQKGQQALGAGE